MKARVVAVAVIVAAAAVPAAQAAPWKRVTTPDGASTDQVGLARKTGKLAIARLVLSSRERVITIGPRESGMFVCTLRNPNEVRGTAEYFSTIAAGEPDPEMLQLAEKLIDQKYTTFDPRKYEDRYEIALMQMIKDKLKGHKPIIAAAPERGNVINLMDALKASLSQAKPPARSKSKAEPAATPAAKPGAETSGRSGAKKKAG